MSTLDYHDNDVSPAEGLLAIFERKDGDARHYSDEDIRAVLPVLLMLGKADLTTLPPNLQRVMAEFGLKLANTRAQSPQELREVMTDHYRRQPLNAELMGQIRQLVTELFLKQHQAKDSKLLDAGRMLSADLVNRVAPTLDQMRRKPLGGTQPAAQSRAGRRQFTLT